jgi:hypothetical protein
VEEHKQPHPGAHHAPEASQENEPRDEARGLNQRELVMASLLRCPPEPPPRH